MVIEHPSIVFSVQKEVNVLGESYHQLQHRDTSLLEISIHLHHVPLLNHVAGILLALQLQLKHRLTMTPILFVLQDTRELHVVFVILGIVVSVLNVSHVHQPLGYQS